jgi:hypothetical protein
MACGGDDGAPGSRWRAPALQSDACVPRPTQHDRRRPRRRGGWRSSRLDGRRGAGHGRCDGASLRRHALGRAQVPARRQGRAESDPCGGSRILHRPLWCPFDRSRCPFAALHAATVARLGGRAGHRHLRRQLGPGIPAAHEGRPLAACLVAPAARSRRAVPHAPPLVGLGTDARHRGAAAAAPGLAPRRNQRARRRAGARTRRCQLVAAGLGRHLGAVLAASWRRAGSTASGELRRAVRCLARAGASISPGAMPATR